MNIVPNPPILLPYPRELTFTEGVFHLSDRPTIKLDAAIPHSLVFSALLLQNSIISLFERKFEITASRTIPNERSGIQLIINHYSRTKPQGYHLQISADLIILEAQDAQGIFYGCYTLIQLLKYYRLLSNEQKNIFLPCLEVNDWPDFLNRGVMIDISRNKVPTMETLFNLVDLLSSWKINQLQLYTEHTFAYLQHPAVWADASPITGEEILKLDAYCRDRFIELVPNQNSFGHLENWLNYPSYKELAEAPNGFDFPWGHQEGAFSLCPVDPRNIEFLSGLYDELFPHYSSRQVNVGCDETFDLGQGRSKDACTKYGVGRVYLDFLLKINKEVTQRGFTMQFWGDMIMRHPELIPELPGESITLEWGYESDHPFDQHGRIFAQSGIPFYVCPGTSSWNSIAGRTDNCIYNLSNAAINGYKHGAIGYLITDWGDNGHWQMLPVSYLGFATGAAYSWAYQSNRKLDIKGALSIFAFDDRTNTLGSIAYEFGNLYLEYGVMVENSSALFNILQEPISRWQLKQAPEITLSALNRILPMIDSLANKITLTDSGRIDGELLRRELSLTADMLHHACLRGLFGLKSSSISKEYLSKDLSRITEEYTSIWLLRNRPGGLRNSLKHFEITMKDYE